MIIICLLAGMIMTRFKLVPEGSHRGINVWIMYIALPSLALRYVPYIEWGFEFILPIIGPALVWLGAVLFINIYSRFNEMDRSTKTVMLVTCALGNTGFMGLPMVTAFYGSAQLPIAIVFDQITFFFFSVLGVTSVLKASAPAKMKRLYLNTALKTLRFPPFIACISSLILPHFIDMSPTKHFFDMLVATLSPMAIFSIGLQLRFRNCKNDIRHLVAGVTYKLILAPLLVAIAAFFIGISGYQAKVSIMQAAMPPHITMSLMTADYGLNPNFCTLMVGVSIIMSFMTSILWWLVSTAIF